jgi:hypothetical protein
MKIITVILQAFFLLSLPIYIGCEPSQAGSNPPAHINKTADTQDYSGYMPAKIDIMPLTDFILTSEAEGSPKLRVYISLLDSFDCQVKSPGVFRFELYEQVSRSPEPKGKRIILWPDIDLTDADKNNQYWKDFLRAYEFNLDFEPKAQQNYILQATFLSPAGRRLSADFNLKSPK